MVIQELLLDRVYSLLDPTQEYAELCKVKVVGIFEMKDPGMYTGSMDLQRTTRNS